MTKQDSQLQKLTEAIEKLVANPVAPIAPVLPIAPIAPIAPLVVTNSGDHDLLTKLDERFTGLDKKFDAMSVKLDTKYTTTEEHKVVTDIQIDHETRIRAGEVFQNNVTGRIWGIGVVAGLVTSVLGVLLEHYLK